MISNYEKGKSKILESARTMKHVENVQYLKFLTVVRRITHNRFLRSSRRTKILTHLSDEIYNCKKSCTPFVKEIVDPEIIKEKEQELEESINEIKQVEKEIFDAQELLDIDLSYDNLYLPCLLH